MIKTPLCDLLGIQHPVMLAGMGGVSYAEVTAAVSAAGGFGTLGMAGAKPDFIEAQMKRVRELTDKPFGVDLLAAQPDSMTAAVDVIIDNGARLFVAGLGIPFPILKRLKDAGVLVMSMVGKVEHAKKAEQAGCDAVIAQGTEGGGHTGAVASIALWPQVVDAVKIPVIAAGGLFDGRGLAAALAMGCQGVWMGTRFIASREAHAGQVYKQALVDMTEADTIISRGFTGKTLRALQNDTTKRFETEKALPFAQQVVESAKLNRLGPIAGKTDNLDLSFQCFPAGQGGGGIREVLSCKEIVDDIVREAEATLKRIGKAVA